MHAKKKLCRELLVYRYEYLWEAVGAKTEKTDSKRAMYRTRSSFFSSVVDPEWFIPFPATNF